MYRFLLRSVDVKVT